MTDRVLLTLVGALLAALALTIAYRFLQHEKRQAERAAERFRSALDGDECADWAAFHTPSSDIPGA